MRYNSFLINGLLLIVLVAVSITAQLQMPKVFDDVNQQTLSMTVAQNSPLIAAPSVLELH